MAAGTLPIRWSAPQSVGLRAALTFDDGPTPLFTPGLLDTLDRLGIQATFFVIGALVERHGDLVRRARDAGHEVANHTYDHLSAAVRTAAEVREAVLRGSECIEKVCGAPPRWLRPPRGEITTATLLAAQEAGLEIGLWSVNRGNSPDADSSGVAEHLSAALRPGSVTGLHDGIGRSSWVGRPDPHLTVRHRAELNALPAAITTWLGQGYRFETFSQLIPRSSA
jgi:peptidoglycan/xylan/chitin deacetylase (PgdA/CDA1 family)